MNATEEEIKKVLQFSFSENEFVSDTEDWESQVMTFIVWFSVEQSIRFIKEKLYAFGD